MTHTNAATNAILSFLNWQGHVAWRNNTTGIFDPKKKLFRMAPITARGTGDIVCCCKGGIYLEVEIKTGRDKLNPAQQDHRERIQKVRGFHIVAGTYDEFRVQYDQIMSQLSKGIRP